MKCHRFALNKYLVVPFCRGYILFCIDTLRMNGESLLRKESGMVSHSWNILFLPFFMLSGLLALAAFAFWIWMLIDCAMYEKSEGNDKIIWILIIIFTHFIGALIYFLIRRPQRKKELGR